MRSFCKAISLNAILITCVGYSVRCQPAPYPSTAPINYVRAFEPVMPEQDADRLITRPVSEVKASTQYLDGLGRPLQSVIRMGSLETSSGNYADLVSSNKYNEYGQEQYKYLPFAANNSGGNPSIADGKFKSNPFQQQAAFMIQQFGSQGENTFYGRTEFEPSPLNRPLENFAPGNSWAGTAALSNETDRRSTKIKYLTNTSLDGVPVFNVADIANSFGEYTSVGTYAPGELTKTITIDENGKQVIEFRNNAGQILLRKVQVSNVVDDGQGSSVIDWIATLYIYDNLQRLRCVVQPKGTDLIRYSWDLDSQPDVLDGLCFRYEYDNRSRLIMRKLPGAQPVFMVYDVRDRMIMMQDANLRALDKWLVTKYDDFDRPFQTGLWLNTSSFQSHLIAAAPLTSYPVTSSNYEQLTEVHYDNYAGLPSGFDGSFNNTWSAEFYNIYNVAPFYAQEQVASNQIIGKVGWSKAKILGTSTDFLYTVNIYDSKDRLIQVKSSNLSSGTDIRTIQYDWSGKSLIAIFKQELIDNTATQTSLEAERNTYDDLGRLITKEMKVSNSLVKVNGILNGMPPYKTILKNEYDKSGQLITKKIGANPVSGNPLEILNSEYNIRGWLTGVNKNFLADAADNYFGYELGYDKAGSFLASANYSSLQLNGNISGLIWKSKGDGEKRKYDFLYDGSNRLLKADFTQKNGNAWNILAGVDYSMQVGDGADPLNCYDLNGNIRSMDQEGLKLNSSSFVDQLSYEYEQFGNKLKVVYDGANDNTSTLGDFKYDAATKTSIDYTYDANGNLTSDANKKIQSIQYNHLNLPEIIAIPGKGTITYTYDASGIKLKKEVFESSTQIAYGGNNYLTDITTTTKYLSGFVFESKSYGNSHLWPMNTSNVLQYLPHDEGRIRFKPAIVASSVDASFAYDYMLKDHLGNVRSVITDEQRQDKYPVASLEPSKVAVEKQYYSIDDNQIVDANPAVILNLPAYTNDNGIGNNPPDVSFESASSTKLYRLNGSSSGTKMGLGITLKVMAGDKIDIFGKSYFFQNNAGGGNANSPILVTALLGGFLGAGAASGATSSHMGITPSEINNGSTESILAGILASADLDQVGGTTPKAYINYLFFDERFNCVGGGISKVGTAGALKDHHYELQNINTPKNGYVYIYCSNESPVDVFFDNLQVVHTRSPLLEETHYYPFGLVMNGISSKAAGELQNKLKYNGKELQSTEFNDGSGLELYDFGARMQDPQIGRWLMLDPLADKFSSNSPYVSMNNNPNNIIDLNGMEGTSTHTDANGKVLLVVNDGDLGVYKHDDAKTAADVQANYSADNTSAGGEKMGETNYWDTFASSHPGTDGNRHTTDSQGDNYVINFTETWDQILEQNNSLLLDILSKKGRFEVSRQLENGGDLVIQGKPNTRGAGKLFEGKYASAEEIGNYVAGIAAYTVGSSFDGFQRVAGALELRSQGQNIPFGTWDKFKLLVGWNYYGTHPLHGELIQQYRWSLKGFEAARQKSYQAIGTELSKYGPEYYK